MLFVFQGEKFPSFFIGLFLRFDMIHWSNFLDNRVDHQGIIVKLNCCSHTYCEREKATSVVKINFMLIWYGDSRAL